jgi:hypothetical protein
MKIETIQMQSEVKNERIHSQSLSQMRLDEY